MTGQELKLNSSTKQGIRNQQFFHDVAVGLSLRPKRLNSKYFYDQNGDKIFQEIMAMPEYYLTRCEMEILKFQSSNIVSTVRDVLPEFDVVELGAGDASKSTFLLKEILKQGFDFTYYPIDISSAVIENLRDTLPSQIPGLKLHGLHGEYLEMIAKSNQLSARPKLFLFMGANIGNFLPQDAIGFCKKLQSFMNPEDLLMVGFDLKKNPHSILAAYNDANGITKKFNLNLLKRINRELDADFILENFDHYAYYDPLSGNCKSFLISLQEQIVRIGKDLVIFFSENEVIDMEISLKYSIEETDTVALQSGFRPLAKFYDSRKWFVDTLWSCPK